jgi:formiminoglutamate deiminase
MQSTAFVLDHAFLPTGWAPDVLIETGEDGLITLVKADAGPCPGVRRLAGAALPGLPNLHSHTFQRGMAGLAERRGPAADSFWSWREVMYGFLGRLTPDDVEAIAAMAMVEMLEGGFTSLAEFHYLHHAPDGAPYANRAEMAERLAAAAATTGICLTLLPVLYAHGGFGGAAAGPGQRRFLNDRDGYLALREGSAVALRGLPGAVLGAAPHSLRAVTAEELAWLANVATGGPIHIHVAEQVKEVEDCLAWSGRRPVEWLLDHAEVDARWTLIHATHMTPDETQAVAASGAVAGLCPITEANLGDGIFEAVAFLGQGGRLGVGSDSNVEITASGELRLLEYGQRLKHRGRNMLAAREGLSTGEALYREALAGGAQALGQPVGALAPGRRADIVTLDLAHPTFAGAGPESWLDAYVFNAGSAAIRDVLVGGRQVVAEGRHLARETVRARFARAMKRLA